MGKHTMGATEVQVIVNLVASYYVLLPPHLFNGSLPAVQPAYLYAFLACRQAIALIRSATSAVQCGKLMLCIFWLVCIGNIIISEGRGVTSVT